MTLQGKLLRIGTVIASIGIVVATASFFMDREESVRVLYATNGGSFEPSAYESLRQSLVANMKLDKADLSNLTPAKLHEYDAVYPDPGLAGDKTSAAKLQRYTADGGYLFLENKLAADYPLDMLGASQLVDVPDADKPAFEYPEANVNLQGMQQVFRLFADNYLKRTDMSAMQGFSWGKGIVPTTAKTLVRMNGVSLYTVNRYGKGTVMLSGTLLPSRYYITGTDMTSGMDPQQGFAKQAQTVNAGKKAPVGALYFNREQLPLEPYFHFAFEAANRLFRGEWVSVVSKQKLGYSLKKVLGPNGRPAMALQNHFEALPAIRDGDGIQWSELLKKYNQIPSYSLVRSSFWWGRWQESVVAHLNVGTQDKPQFAGETPNSFYSSGTHLIAGGKPIRLADYPDYKSLGDPIEKPYRAFPSLVDVTGDGKPDLLAGSADGSVAVYANAGADPAAYGSESLPQSLPAPDAFAAPQPLRLAGGAPLAASGGFAAVAAGDLNGDGRPDLVVGSGDGSVQAALSAEGGFAAPAPLSAGGVPLRADGPAAPAVGDVDGDGVPDIVVGDGSGRVTLYRGVKGRPLAFEEGREAARVAAFAAPSLRDMNGDGRLDLVVGSLEGDLRIFTQGADGGFTAAGVIESATLNQVGSHTLVGGHNSVPLWSDINHDGKDDLIVGQLEFGSPTPIDDPNFPAADQLKAFIDYAKNNFLELYPHIFVHNYTSESQEKQELALHKAAFDKLGIPWTMTGTNQHTWRVNNPDPTQTLRNERSAGLWFNFGFRPAHAPNDPRLGTTPEYMWGLPFMLSDPKTEQPMLIHTPSPILRVDPTYSTVDLYNSYAALDMPIDYFEHIEYHFPNRVGELLEFVTFLDNIRNQYDYNFVTEPQMARSFLAAMTSEAVVTRSWGAIVWDKVLRTMGLNPERTLEVKARTDAVPDLAGPYKDAIGFAIDPGGSYAGKTVTTDADVYEFRGGKLYFAAAHPVAVTVGSPVSSRAVGGSVKPPAPITAPAPAPQAAPNNTEAAQAPAARGSSAPAAGTAAPAQAASATPAAAQPQASPAQGAPAAPAQAPAPAVPPANQPVSSTAGGEADMHLMRVNVPFTLTKRDGSWTVELRDAGLQQIKVWSPSALRFEGDGTWKMERSEADQTYTLTRYGDRTTLRIIY